MPFRFLTFLLCVVVCTGSRHSGIWSVEKRNVARTWCVASSQVGDDKLQGAIAKYCNQRGVDCSVIKPGGSCYQPNTVRQHASVVLNLYYKAHNETKPYCPFDVASLSLMDPSSGTCKYP